MKQSKTQTQTVIVGRDVQMRTWNERAMEWDYRSATSEETKEAVQAMESGKFLTFLAGPRA